MKPAHPPSSREAAASILDPSEAAVSILDFRTADPVPVLRPDAGFTLVEVVVCLVIVASAFLPLMATLGSSAEKVLNATLHRKMRYLMQIQAGDVEIQQIKPPGDGEDAEDAERYEEGSRGTFENYASDDLPSEYDHFKWEVEIYREELICGASDDPEALMEAGFETDPAGQIVGRPVTNDRRGEEGEEEPEGQMKRLMVLTVRCESEDADQDLEFRIMTYLPVPGEEDRQIGGEAGGPLPPGGGEAGGDTKAGGGAAGETRATGGEKR